MAECKVSFLGTKVENEIKMKKAEPGSWAKLDIPKPLVEKKPAVQEPKVVDVTDDIDDLDLDDLDVAPAKPKMTLSKEASGAWRKSSGASRSVLISVTTK